MPAPPAPSQTDPYAPEPETTKPVLVRLVYIDGRQHTINSDERVMKRRVVRFGGQTFLWRADAETNGRWCRVYLESPPFDLE